MDLPPFLLDQWIGAHAFASPPVRYNLAASTGPVWTLGELMQLGDGSLQEELAKLKVSYAPPEGSADLRRAIAAFAQVDPDWVVVTTGASEALSVLFCSAAGPDGTVALPNPAFPAFAVMARAWGLGIRTYEVRRDDGFAQSAARVLSATDDNTRLALVNSPHNPSGSLMSRHETAQLAEALAPRGIPLVVDEVYHPLYFQSPMRSAAHLPNTLIVGDLSKALSLSGLRIGWIIDRDAARRERLINLRSYFTVSGSPITEAIAAHALRNRTTLLARLEEVARANLAALDEFMHSQRALFGWIPPAGGTVAFPWRLDQRSTRPMCETLARAGVLVVPGDCFHAESHWRVGFGTQAAGFADALKVAAHALASSGA
jgi:aspartate/methionine/tyrosine aminotransferase